MPLQRSPKKSSMESGQKKNEKNILDFFSSSVSNSMRHADSEPSLNAMPIDDQTAGYKRKHSGEDDQEVRTSMAEIRMLFTASSYENDKKFECLRKSLEQSFLQSINELKAQNEAITKSMELISDKYDEMTTHMKKVENEQKDQKRYIHLLEQKIELLERKNVSSSIEIRNIPKLNASETKEDLIKTVKNISDVLKVPIDKMDIKDIYRTNTKIESNKPITLEFTRTTIKEDLLKSVKAFNKANRKEDKLNTSHLRIVGQPKPIYITESLTQKARKLFFLSREFARNNNFQFCWTAHGQVFLRKAEGAPQTRVESENVLSELVKQN